VQPPHSEPPRHAASPSRQGALYTPRLDRPATGSPHHQAHGRASPPGLQQQPAPVSEVVWVDALVRRPQQATQQRPGARSTSAGSRRPGTASASRRSGSGGGAITNGGRNPQPAFDTGYVPERFRMYTEGHARVPPSSARRTATPPVPLAPSARFDAGNVSSVSTSAARRAGVSPHGRPQTARTISPAAAASLRAQLATLQNRIAGAVTGSAAGAGPKVSPLRSRDVNAPSFVANANAAAVYGVTPMGVAPGGVTYDYHTTGQHSSSSGAEWLMKGGAPPPPPPSQSTAAPPPQLAPEVLRQFQYLNSALTL
jgi:hypothetical protein